MAWLTTDLPRRNEVFALGYYYTSVPVCWGPNKSYDLPPNVSLAPSGQSAIPDYPAPGMNLPFDHVLFISGADNEKQHIDRLQQWVLFHAFLLNDLHLCSFFETGRLHPHECVESLVDIPKAASDNANPCDFDNVSNLVYFMHAPAQSTNYRKLWVNYKSLAPTDLHLIRTLLFQTDPRKTWQITYNLFPDMRQRWQATNYLTILEAIIGHAENCPESEKKCNTCGRQVNPHRRMSEDMWRRQYLSNLGVDSPIIDDYVCVIRTAYKGIRSRTAHPSGALELPPTYPSVEGTQVYDVPKSTQEYPHDLFALDSLLQSLYDITRYLLLHRVFKLSIFPELDPLKATSVGSNPV